MNTVRRQFLSRALSCAAAAALPCSYRASAASRSQFGSSEIIMLSDGHLSLPSSFLVPDGMQASDIAMLLQDKEFASKSYEPHCNLTLWKTEDRLILFDVGAGSHFMQSTGKLLADLETAGIEPDEITDILLTHGHPDHLWGLLDDFDDLAFPQARYFMNTLEWDYWRDEQTINRLPESRKVFAVGAANRLAYLEERIQLFSYGDEVLPGIEAIDTRGHTPGHTSFALHQGAQGVVVAGDAITHAVLSFDKANWPSASDQNPEAARLSRLNLLDRLAQDKHAIIGFHLPHPGLGRVERQAHGYRYVPDA